MFKRLKKTFIGGRSSKKTVRLSSELSSGNDDLSKGTTSSQSTCSPESVVNQEVLNLGGEFGKLSLDHGCPRPNECGLEDTTVLDSTLYTTAIDSTIQNSPPHFTYPAVKTMDESYTSDESPNCVTALEDTFTEAFINNANAEHNREVTIDPLEDCLSAFSSLSLASNTPKQTSMLKAVPNHAIFPNADRLKPSTSSGSSSPYVVFDLEADGSTVESRAVISTGDSLGSGDACRTTKESVTTVMRKTSSGDTFNDASSFPPKNDTGSNIIKDDNSDSIFFDAVDDVKEGNALSDGQLPTEESKSPFQRHDNKVAFQHEHTARKYSANETFSDAIEEPLSKGSCSLDLNKIDAPEYDPFKSTKSLVDSPSGTVPCDSAFETETEEPKNVKSLPTYAEESSTSLPLVADSDSTVSCTLPATVDNEPVLPNIKNVNSEKLSCVNSVVKYPAASHNVLISTEATEREVSSHIDVQAKSNAAGPSNPTFNSNSADAEQSTSFANKDLNYLQCQEHTSVVDEQSLERGSYSIDFKTVDLDKIDPFGSSIRLLNSPSETLQSAVPSLTISSAGMLNENNSNPTNISEQRYETEHVFSGLKPDDYNTTNFSPAITSDLADKFENSSDTSTIKADSVNATPTRRICSTEIIDLDLEENLTVNIEDENVIGVSQGVEHSVFEQFGKLTEPEANNSVLSQTSAVEVAQSTSDANITDFNNASIEQSQQVNNICTLSDNGVIPARSTYSVELSCFDDPNFDPFKTNKSLLNDHDDPITENGCFNSTPSSTSQDTDSRTKERKEGNGCVSSDTMKKQEKPDIDAPTQNFTSKSNETIVFSPTKESSDLLIKSSLKIEKADNDLIPCGSSETIPVESITEPIKDKAQQLVPKPLATPTIISQEFDELPIAKGTYSMDFSKFDDPNFDPFKTTKSLMNEEVIKKLVAVKETPMMNMYNHGNANKGSLASSDTVTSSTLLYVEPENSVSSADVIAETDKEEKLTVQLGIEYEGGTHKDTLSSFSLQTTDPTKVENLFAEAETDSLSPPVSKETYSINYSKFDDPNFDPFKTGKSFVNDEAQDQLPSAKESHAITNEKLEDPKFDPFQIDQGIVHSPVKEHLELSQELLQSSYDQTKSAGASIPKKENLFKSNEFNNANDGLIKTASGIIILPTETTENSLSLIHTNTDSYHANEAKDSATALLMQTKSTSLDILDFTKSSENQDVRAQDIEAIESQNQKATYSMDFNKFDDPNFNPFTTTKCIVNSPASENADLSVAIIESKTVCNDLTEKELVGTKMVQNGFVEIEKDTQTKAATSKQARPKLEASTSPNLEMAKPAGFISAEDVAMESKVFSEEVDEQPVAKGAYSMDFSKFDDPNFDPFKTTKSLLNDEGNEKLPSTAGSYTMDCDQYEGFNLDSCNSNKVLESSPTKGLKETPFTSVKVTPIQSVAEVEGKDSSNHNASVKRDSQANLQSLPSSKNKVRSKMGKGLNVKKAVTEKSVEPVSDDIVPDNTEHYSGSPPPSVGSYSIDFNKLDDPNFDPFASKGSLLNDETGEESHKAQGSYLTDPTKFDSPAFDPFKSNNGILNSPSEASSSTGIEFDQACSNATSEEHDKVSVESVSTQQPNKKNDLCSKTKTESSRKNEQDVKEPASEPTTAIAAGVQEDADQHTDTPPAVPKGAYSMDFSKFDNPNFDPFKSGKTLVNDVADEEMPISKGAYTMNFDDPNFDPFKSNKTISNASSADTDKIPTVVDSAAPESTTFTESTAEKPRNEKKAPMKLVKKSSGKPSKLRSELASLRKKQREEIKDISIASDDMEDPIPPKGSYSVDISKFEDPNFDPFASKGSLFNDEARMELPVAQESHSIDLDECDDPTFESFKSNKRISNSPTECSKEISCESKIDQELSNSTSEEHCEVITESTGTELPNNNSDLSSETITKSTASETKEREEPVSELPAVIATRVEEDAQQYTDSLPAVSKGAYSMDFSKFDDPNFDPFKSGKTLVNDVTDEEMPISKGAYTMDFDKFDDPNFDPFKSNKTVSNSLSTDTNKSPAVVDFAASENAPVSESSTEKVGDEKKVPKKLVKKGTGKSKGKPSKLRSELAALRRKQRKEMKVPSANDVCIEEPIPEKGSYSVDLTKYDDPNFDPFKSGKTLVNVVANEEIPISKGAYTMDFDKFDDPNFDPFKSNKATSNTSPIGTDKIPTVIDSAPSENTTLAESAPEKTGKDKKVPTKLVKKSSGKPSKLRSELAALRKKQRQEVKDVSIANDDVEDPILPKGSYSVDVSKFEDPSFDPFKSSNALSNENVPPMEANTSTHYLTRQSEEPSVGKNITQETSNKSLPANDSSDTTSSANDTAILTDGSNNQNRRLDDHAIKEVSTPQNKKNTVTVENFQSPVDECFQPAEQVLNDPKALKSWEDLWDKENDSSKTAIESELRKQSLYVQFDPLVEPIAAIEKAMHPNRPQKGSAVAYFDAFDDEADKTLTGEIIREDSMVMTSSSPTFHPAVSQLAHNLNNEKWNENLSEPATGTLISFSPEQNAAVARRNLQGLREHQEEASKYEMVRLEKEKKDLEQKKEALRASLEDLKIQASACKTTESELEKVIGELRCDLDAAHVDKRRVLDDIVSAKRVYHDYHIKASELLPVLQAHKQNDQELREVLDTKLNELSEKTKRHRELKMEADSTKSRLSTEVSKARSAMEREIGALQAKYKREQMAVTSISAALQDKIRENEELTKICDELIAGVEHKS